MTSGELYIAPALSAARQSLGFARQGADDYKAGGDRRVSGLFNFATSSRTVTFALQNMRGHVDGFDQWYALVEAELRASPVAQWAKNLRNRVEKQGDPGPRSSMTQIRHLNTSMFAATAPAGTVSTIIGDRWGRNYWIVRLRDGTEENVYFNLDPRVGRNSIVFEDAPGRRDIPDLMDEHLRTLDYIVTSAEKRFSA